MKNSVSTQNLSKSGFSLVEMLVVIAVIGIIAAIAVPNVSRIHDSANDSSYRRNAQNLASIYTSALLAGHDFNLVGGVPQNDVITVVQAVITGVEINSPNTPFHQTFFGMPGIDTSLVSVEGERVLRYLRWDNNLGLVYDPAP